MLDAADVVLRVEGAGALGAVVGCSHAMAGREEEVVDLVVGGEEALSAPGRPEPLHPPFPSPCWLVRVFRPVVEPLVLAVLNSRHNFLLGRAENTLDLLRRSPDLVGLYIAGGGAEGVPRALTENGGRNGAGDRIVTVCFDLTDHTRTGLINNIVQAVISHPIGVLANQAVELMARQTCSAEERNQFSQVIIPFEIFTPESV